MASLQTLTLRSSVRFRGVAPHHRSPTSAIEPAGQDLAAPSRFAHGPHGGAVLPQDGGAAIFQIEQEGGRRRAPLAIAGQRRPSMPPYTEATNARGTHHSPPRA